MSHHHVLILGSGPAGLTAAIYTARANLSPLLIHGPTPGGQLTITTEVENFPGFPEGIQGPELMKHMEDQARRFGTDIKVAIATSVDLSQKPYKVVTANETYTTDALIVATGASPKWLNIPGEKELMGFGVSSCATCDGAFFRDQVICIAGGGDSACEEALFLTRFGSQVYLIHRRDELRASKIMQDRVLAHPKLKVLWNKAPVEIKGNKNDGVQEVVLKDTVTGEVSTLPTAAFFIAIGHTPTSQLFTGQLPMDENGYIKVVPGTPRTEKDGVFVCGDVQDHVYRQAITAAGTGCMAAIEAERYLESLKK